MPGRFLYFSEVLLRLMPEQDYAVRLEALAEALQPRVVAAVEPAEGAAQPWDVVGPLCETGDVLARDVEDLGIHLDLHVVLDLQHRLP